MRRILIPALLAAVAFAGLSGSPSSVSAVPLPSVTKFVFDDPELECFQLTPTQVSTPPPAAGGAIDLSVAVLRDRGVTAARLADIFNKAKASYAPLNITLSLHSDTAVTFTGTSANGILDQAKAVFGGTKPAGADIVGVFTNADISEGGSDFQGMADCIGGVGFPGRSFFVVEDVAETFDLPDEGFGIEPVLFYVQFTAKAFAHEIGHLMGAHHHYGNCVEGVPTEPLEVAPCTLMGPLADAISFNFSTLNAAIVRGHAEAFAN